MAFTDGSTQITAVGSMSSWRGSQGPGSSMARLLRDPSDLIAAAALQLQSMLTTFPATNNLVIDVSGTTDFPGPWELSQTAAQLMPWHHPCFCCHRRSTRCACHYPHGCASRQRPPLHHTALASEVGTRQRSGIRAVAL